MAAILIAEDDEDVRKTVCRALELTGHEVHPTCDGAEAMNRLHSNADSIDLLLTDIKMPVMDGIALSLSVAKEWPQLPILMMTGFSDQRERADGLENLIKGVIAKPFTLQEIQEAVTNVLDDD
jgi:two-component system, cell cycle response regulator CpdR